MNMECISLFERRSAIETLMQEVQKAVPLSGSVSFASHTLPFASNVAMSMPPTMNAWEKQ